MKKNIFVSCAIAALLLPAATSCSSEYLDELPRTGISDETVRASEDGAHAALTGLARQMSRQWDDLKNSNLNASGELFFRTVYGEGLSPDANFAEIIYYSSSSTNPANFRNQTGWWAAWMYNYSYSLIYLSNTILGSLPEDYSGENEEIVKNNNWLKACTLTFRAHAYYRLLQVYSPRWQDSENGEKLCFPLRLKANQPNEAPLNKVKEVYEAIYNDLDLAIELFKNIPADRKDRGTETFFPDASVAKGIYSRVALLKNDYAKAKQMAKEAREGYPLMTADEYLTGFSTTCKGWMWAPAMDPLGLYYWGFGPHYACNGHYVNSWGYSSNMDWHLLREFKVTDVRSQLYFGPLTVEHAPDLAKKYNITAEDIINANITTPRASLSITGSGTPEKGSVQANLYNFIKAYGKTFADRRPADIKGIYPNNKYGMSIGVHYKFQGLPDGYTSCFPPYMRAEEMLLNEAEAAYMTGDETTAKALIEELMAQRDATYTLDATGDALLAEIKLQRKLELWGEGFSFFDYKRWNETIERRGWNKNDLENSGFWPKKYALTYEPDYMNGWVAALPQSEFLYNKEANASDLGL